MKKYPLTAPSFDKEELHLVGQAMESGWVTQGPFAKQFEDLFAARHQAPYALAVSSCTAALHLATTALNLGPGDEVIVPAFTWVTSAHSAEYVGAKAVFADIDLTTFNLDPAAFEAAITPRTAAVVVVHLFGLSAKMDEILAIAKRHKLAVIEDAACAIGTEYDRRPVGVFGDIGCFSFHPRKVITTGEGGMVTLKDEALRDKVASLRNHGAGVNPPGINTPSKPYQMGSFNQLGFNLRLSDIQAAVGVAQMAKLENLLAQRKIRAERYDELLTPFSDLATPNVPAKCQHTYQSYVLRVLEGGMKRRNAIMDYLVERNVQTRPGTHAVHRLGYYREKYGLRPEMFPNACMGEDLTITLPLYPGMTDADQDVIVEMLSEGLKQN